MYPSAPASVFGIMRKLTCLLGLLLLVLAGCERELPEGDPRASASGTHPWDRQGSELKFPPELKKQESGESDSAEVSIPAGRGPAFSEKDTIVAKDVAGIWLQVCSVQAEKMNMIPVNYQDLMELKPDGYALYKNVDDWTESPMEGRWKKAAPGQLGLMFGGPEYTGLHAQMQGSNFLYVWSYEYKTAFWWVKLPREATDRVMHNRFNTNRGMVELTNVVGASFSGKVTGVRPMTLHGLYQKGVIVVRWEEEDRSAAGFGAFVVDVDWKNLTGTWWIDDYEASPFGGDWSGPAE